MLKKLLTPQDGNIRRHQRILSFFALGIVGVIIFVFVLFILGRQQQGRQQETAEKIEKKQLTSPMDVVDDKEVWASRVEKRAETAEKQVQKLESETHLMQKQIELLEQIMKHGQSNSNEGRGGQQDIPTTHDEQKVKDSVQQNLYGQQLPGQPRDETRDQISDEGTFNEIKASAVKVSGAEYTETGSKILHIGVEGMSLSPLHTTENYIPSGTYAKAVLTSGVVASTSTQAQGNPQPIMLRLADEGNLPRGWKSTVKDAVLIGACYGDLSSERVLCRLESMSWVEPSGETVERKVEGWIIGEDGRPGLRGLVVDRAGEVARESFVAGILSGLANFLQFESTRGVYPMTPFGQTNALSTTDALAGGLGKGATNALDKLAEFSIKRAESMSPVLVVNSGRVVDVVFRKGVDLFGAQGDYKMGEYKVIGSEQVPTAGVPTPQQTMLPHAMPLHAMPKD